MAQSQPTIVLIPGAWLPSAAYEAWTSELEERGYPFHIAQYPSCDPNDPTTADVASDAATIRKTLLDLIETQGRSLVLVMHSYGGMPGSAAAKCLSITERRSAGLPGGIAGLIYVAAFIVPEGKSCAGMTGGQLAPWILDDTPHSGVNVPQDPANMFKHGFSRAEAGRLGAVCRPQATRAFTTAQPPSALQTNEKGNGSTWEGRLGYVVTTKDDEIPEQAQRGMCGSIDRGFMVREVRGSHMAPFGGHNLAQSLDILAEMATAFRRN